MPKLESIAKTRVTKIKQFAIQALLRAQHICSFIEVAAEFASLFTEKPENIIKLFAFRF